MIQPLPGGYELDDDRSRVDVAAVHRFLSEESYWAKGRPFDVVAALVERAWRVAGLYAPDGSQAGFARVVSDGVAHAYLADVFVVNEHRGEGRGVALVTFAVDGDPPLARCRWVLHTADAHALYAKLGFGPPSERILERPPTWAPTTPPTPDRRRQ